MITSCKVAALFFLIWGLSLSPTFAQDISSCAEYVRINKSQPKSDIKDSDIIDLVNKIKSVLPLSVDKIQVVRCEYIDTVKSVYWAEGVGPYGAEAGAYIFYSPRWVHRMAGPDIADTSSEDYAKTVFIIGHEIGHLMNQDWTLNVNKSRLDKETAADKFGGCAVGGVGVSWAKVDHLISQLRDKQTELNSDYPDAFTSKHAAYSGFTECAPLAISIDRSQVRQNGPGSANLAKGDLLVEDGKYQDALDFYKKAAQEGNNQAEEFIGDLYLKGKLGFKKEQNEANALNWYELAAKHGNWSAENAIGVICTRNKYYEGAYRHYKIAADHNVAAAIYDIGLMFEEGRGNFILKDRKAAFDWYEKAAESDFANLGRSYARIKVGVFLIFGIPGRLKTPGDLKEALDWFLLGLDQGSNELNPEAQVEIGKYFSQYCGGNGCLEAAKPWFKMAADQGNDKGEYYLAKYYLDKSQMTPAEVDFAIHLLEQSAAQNFDKAQKLLIAIYDSGVKVNGAIYKSAEPVSAMRLRKILASKSNSISEVRLQIASCN